MMTKTAVSAIAVATTLILMLSNGYAANDKNKDKGGKTDKIGICHLEADGSYTLYELQTKPALNHLEKHSFGGEGDRVANEEGNCEFAVVPDCPCFAQGGAWSDTWPEVPEEFTVPALAASGDYYLTDEQYTENFTRINFRDNETMVVYSSTNISYAPDSLLTPTYHCLYYTTDKQDLSVADTSGRTPAETISICRAELYELFGQTAPSLQSN